MLDRTVAISRKVKNPIIAITMDDLITSASPGEELHTKTPNEIIKAIVTPLLNPDPIYLLATRNYWLVPIIPGARQALLHPVTVAPVLRDIPATTGR